MATYEEHLRGDRAMKEVENSRGPIIYVDGGARNGARELAGIAERVEVYGFEPNHAEFGILPDNDKQYYANGGYRETVYYETALAESMGVDSEEKWMKLNISRRPGATSTLTPNRELLAQFAADNWSQMGEIVEQVLVKGITLDSLNFPYIDYLKLDTQGNELYILRSAPLDKIGVIKVEVELIPIYKDQPLIGDVCVFLAENGFEMVDLQFSEPCRRFHVAPDLADTTYRLVWGDAIFYRTVCERRREQALVLGELGYRDLAMFLDKRLSYPKKSRLRALVEPSKQVNSLK